MRSMGVVFLSLVLCLIFAVGGLLVWLMVRLLMGIPGSIWKIFKGTLFAFLVCLPLFIFLVSPLVISALIARGPPGPRHETFGDTPSSYGIDFSNVQFPSRDGLTLRGWFMEGEKSKPTIIACHGFFRSRQELLKRSCDLAREGFSVLLFDFRSHGNSDRQSISLGFLERLDVLGAYDFLKKTHQKKRFVLLGVSMGAVAAIHAADDLKSDLKAVIADSPFESLQEVISHHTQLFFGLPSFPFADLLVWNLARINGYKAQNLNTLRALRRLREIPVLMFHGEDDRRIRVATARRIFQAIPSGRKKIVFFENATHGAAHRTDPDLYLETIVEFLEAADR